MTDKKQTTHSNVGPIISAVAGAVVGVMALKDEKNREKVKDALTSAKDHAVDFVEDVQKQIQTK